MVIRKLVAGEWKSKTRGAFIPPVSPGGGGDPVETIAIISAFPEQEASARSVLTDLGWSSVSFYAVAGKTLNTADANGKTTVQNVADARAALGAEPAVWVLDVEQGAPTAGAASQAQAILAAVGGSARQVTWVGGGYPNASPNATVDAVRAAVEPVVTAHQNGLYSEWRYYIQCHDDTRDKLTGAATSWWSGASLSTVGVQRKTHHTYRVQVGPPVSKPGLWWNPTKLVGYVSPTRVGTTYTDIRSIPGYSKSKTLKDNLAGLTTASVVSLPAAGGGGPNGEYEIVNFGAPWLGGIRIGAAGTAGNQLVRGFRGDGPNVSKIKLRPNSSTFASQAPTTPGTINPFTVIQVSGITQFEATNVGFYGSPQGHDYHGLTVGESGTTPLTTDAFIDGCKFVGFSKGSDDKPPGECMALRMNNTPDTYIMNSEFDGRFEDTGQIASASMIGFNGPGSSLSNPVNHGQRAHIENIWYHDGYTGMLTFWLWDSATTINFWSDNPGGVNNGTGYNHEEAGSNGRPFLHYNPSLLIRGYYESLYSPHLPGTNSANRSLHWSMSSGNHDVTNLRVYFIRPDDTGVTASAVIKGVQYKRHDRGPGAGSGTYAGLGVQNGNSYPAGVANSNQAQGSAVKVFKALPGNVVRQLTAIPYTAASNQTGDTAVVYYR